MAVPPATDATDILLGDRYRLEEVIGSGGMASVYRARDEHLGRNVAIKLYDAVSADIGRQEGEISVLASLDHHCLVSLYDAGVSYDANRRANRYLVMAYITGTNLRERLRGPRITARNIAEIGYDMAEALEYIHSRNVIHRDIKPSNILLVDYGINTRRARAKLTDFGIALADDSERLTLDGQTTGTAAYLSPEQASGAEVGPATDVYALGLVLLQCFTRTIEFQGTVVESAVARLTRDPVVPEYLPAHWKRLFASTFARKPESRPSGRDLVQMMRQIVIAESARHKEPVGDFPGTSAVRDYIARAQSVDTIPDEILHRVTAMAARLFNAPISAVTLYEDGRTRFVSHFGDDVEAIMREVDLTSVRSPSAEPIFIEDARQDDRSKDNPLVTGSLGMRFYAGAPLVRADGSIAGTLSVMNREAFRPNKAERASFIDLAALVVAQIDQRADAIRTADRQFYEDTSG